MTWISVNDQLPKISYLESDNENDPYKSYPVLLYARSGNLIVGYLVKEQNEKSWNYGDLSSEAYIPGDIGIFDIDFDIISHWMPLPSPPE